MPDPLFPVGELVSDGKLHPGQSRRLKFFPIMNSDIGKFLGAYVPPKIIDKFTHII